MTRLGTRLRSVALLCISMVGFSGTVSAQLEMRATYPVLPSPVSIAVGDFNGDGSLDLAVAGLLGTTQVSVLIGNGDGTFQPAVNYAVGNQPRSVAVGDFNNDGKVDLVTANALSNNVSVLLGNGNGTFQPPMNFGAPEEVQFVATGDFNGDGNVDLVTTSEGACPCVSVLLGNGDGTFQPALIDPLQVGPTAVAVGDFNHDGKLDAAASGYLGIESGAVVLLGKGDGTFQPAVFYSAGDGPNYIAAADFRSDGNLDLALAYGGGVAVLLGNGDGTFGKQVEYPAPDALSVAVVDFNGDGRPDIVMPSFLYPAGVSVLLGNGNGTFRPPMFFQVAREIHFAAVGDFNGDHQPDVAVADYRFNTVVVLLNTGAISFSPVHRLEFLSQPVGTTSPSQSVTLTNTGQTSISISSLSASGPFDLVSSCQGTLAPGADCAVNVSFSPQTKGVKTGLVRIHDNASSKPQIIELGGTATADATSPSN